MVAPIPSLCRLMNQSESRRYQIHSIMRYLFSIALLLIVPSCLGFHPHSSPPLRPSSCLPPKQHHRPYFGRSSVKNEVFWSHHADFPRKVSVRTSLAATTARLGSLGGDGRHARSAFLSTSLLVVLDVTARRLLRHYGISFPSSLAACGAVLVALLLWPQRKVAPAAVVDKDDDTRNSLLTALRPGARLLAQWLPVFFVPSLVTLPLTETVAGPELAKVMAVIVGGLLGSLLSTSFAVVAVREVRRSKDGASNSSVSSKDEKTEITATPATASTTKTQPVAFSNQLTGFLGITTVISALCSWLVSSKLSSIAWLGTTLTSFCIGSRLPDKLKSVVHPLVTCTALTWTVILGWCALSHRTFASVLKGYTRGGGIRGLNTGAGDVLLFWLGPAVVSLAVSVYEKRRLVQENWQEVSAGITVSTLGGLFGTALAVRWIELVSPYLRLSLLSRNITSPLAMAIAGILGANVSLAVSMVVVTGLLGANFGAVLLSAFGIRDPVARGLGMGAAAHGLGTAAMAKETDAFPFAAISMALTATVATVTVSIPFMRRLLLQLALGS